VLRVTGSGFMHNMVRIIVGTLVDVARKRLSPGAVERALRDGDRRSCGVTAPSDGLLLETIDLNPSVKLEATWPC
jgi:tRNA pseudouridine38-40 synthase